MPVLVCSRNLLGKTCTEKAEASSFNAVTIYMRTLVEDHASGRWGKTKRESILHHTRMCFWLLLYHRVLLVYRHEQKSSRIISLNGRRRRRGGGRRRRLWTRYILLCFGHMPYGLFPGYLHVLLLFVSAQVISFFPMGIFFLGGGGGEPFGGSSADNRW